MTTTNRLEPVYLTQPGDSSPGQRNEPLENAAPDMLYHRGVRFVERTDREPPLIAAASTAVLLACRIVDAGGGGTRGAGELER
jgi:hypothetical protein